tara:strand:+ start:87 stop:278 length:192 start_codon:yes stop_codon:yes gene_type:complete
MGQVKLMLHDVDVTYDPDIEIKHGKEKAIEECSKALIKMDTPVDTDLIRQWRDNQDWIDAAPR